ncbi:MAG TPA: hypothetical protein VH024_17350 [Candidatus Angelobacter sp.]|jgi:hypothetical protein|nr:hypothetical protein [Candidatus Angelobacter sp.]
MNDLTSNDMLALAHLFSLAVTDGVRPRLSPDKVFVLVPVDLCGQLARFLFAESIRAGDRIIGKLNVVEEDDR